MSYADGLQNVPQSGGYFCDPCRVVLADAQDFQIHMSNHHMYAVRTSSAVPSVYSAAGVQSSKQPRAVGNADGGIGGSISVAGSSGASSNPVTSAASLMNATQPFTGYMSGPFSGSMTMLQNPAASYSQYQPSSDASSSASDNLLCLSQVAVHQLATQSLQEMLLARRSATSGSAAQSDGAGQVGGFATASAALCAAATATQQHQPQQQQQAQLKQQQQQQSTPTLPAIQLVQHQQQQQQAMFQLQPMTLPSQQQQVLQQQHHHQQQHQQQQQTPIALNFYSLPAHLYGQHSNMAAVTSIGTLYSPPSSSAALHSSHVIAHHQHSAVLATSGSTLNAVSASGHVLAISGPAGSDATAAARQPLGASGATQPVVITSAAATTTGTSCGPQAAAGDRAFAPPRPPPSCSATLPFVAAPPALAISSASSGLTSAYSQEKGCRSDVATGEDSWCGRSTNRARRATNGSRCAGGSERPPSVADLLPVPRSGVDILAEATKQVLLLGDLLPPPMAEQNQHSADSADPALPPPASSSPPAAASASTAGHSGSSGSDHCIADSAAASGLVRHEQQQQQQQLQCQPITVAPPVLVCCQLDPTAAGERTDSDSADATASATACVSGYVRATLSFAFTALESVVRTALEASEPHVTFRCRYCQHSSADAAEAAKHHVASHLQQQPPPDTLLAAACQMLSLPSTASTAGTATATGLDSPAPMAAVEAASVNYDARFPAPSLPIGCREVTAVGSDGLSAGGDRMKIEAQRTRLTCATTVAAAADRQGRSSDAGVEPQRAYECARCGESLIGQSRYAAHRRQCLRASRRRTGSGGAGRPQKTRRLPPAPKPRKSATAESKSSTPVPLCQQLCRVAGCGGDVPQRERAAYWACHRIVSASDGDSAVAAEQQHAFLCHLCCDAADGGAGGSSAVSIVPLFGTWRQCLEHLLAAHEPSTRQSLGGTRFRCGSCREVCASRQQLNRHSHERHSTAFPQWACPRCGEQSFSQESFDAHLAMESACSAAVAASAAATSTSDGRANPPAAAATPDSVDASVVSRDTATGAPAAAAKFGPLATAVKPRHSSLVSCRGCGKKFLNDSRLQRHLLTNACSLPVPRVYRCECCTKSFARRSMLINHQIWCLYQTKSSEPPASGGGGSSRAPASDGGHSAEGNASGSGNTTAAPAAGQDVDAMAVLSGPTAAQLDVAAANDDAAAATTSALDSLAAAAIAALRPSVADEEQPNAAGAISTSCHGTQQLQEQPQQPFSAGVASVASPTRVASTDVVAAGQGQTRQSRGANQEGGVPSRGGVGGRKTGGGGAGGAEKRRYKCTQANCFTMLGSELELSVHRQCHTKDNHELQCFKCSFAPTHNHWFPLKEHFIAMHEGTLEAKFKCVTCGKGFAKQKKYSEHLKIHSEDKTYQCAECGMSFKQQCSLRHHVIVAHADPVLKEAAANENALKKKPADEKKAHLCHICGYSTDSGSYFTTHMNIHKGVKPFSCPFCSYESVDRACFKRHAWRHKPDKPYRCSLCSYAGIQKAQLVAHMKTKHPSSHGSDACEPDTGADGRDSEVAAGEAVVGAGSTKGRRRGRRPAVPTADVGGCSSGSSSNIPAIVHYPAGSASVVTAVPMAVDAQAGTSYRILSVVGTDVLMQQGSLVLATAGTPGRMGMVLGSGGGTELSLSTPAALLSGCPAGSVGGHQAGQHHVMQLQQLPDYLSSFYNAATAATDAPSAAAATPGSGGTLHTLLL